MTDYSKILNTIPLKNYLEDTIEFSCEILNCDDKAAYRENTTEMATGKNSDLYLCYNHFFSFKELVETNIGIDKPKIKARQRIEFRRNLRKNKPFNINDLR